MKNITFRIEDIHHNIISEDTIEVKEKDILIFQQTEECSIPQYIILKLLNNFCKKLKNEEEPIALFLPQGINIKVLKVKEETP